MHQSKVQNYLYSFLISLLIIFSCTDIQNQKQIDQTSIKEKRVTLFNTEQRTIHSNILNKQFDIYISLPYSYSNTNIKYPVFFNLDANVAFGTVDNVVHILNLNRQISEIIVVGIAYKIESIVDWAAWRWYDFKPTSQPEKDKIWEERLSTATGRDDIVVTSGGADKFLEFIINELIPFIESNYRVSSSDRGIGGISASGLFTLYTLFQRTEMFQRYFAGSPSINWDENYMYKLEEELASSQRDFHARLFMCTGSLESDSYINNVNKMDDLLRSRNYTNFVIETVIFKDETHASISSAAIARAIKMLYQE